MDGILNPERRERCHIGPGYKILEFYCNISSVMNPYCKVATSIGIMPLHLIINSEGCCVANLFCILFHILRSLCVNT